MTTETSETITKPSPIRKGARTRRRKLQERRARNAYRAAELAKKNLVNEENKELFQDLAK